MVEFRDITPEGNRCGGGACPSVHISSDLKTLRVTGNVVSPSLGMQPEEVLDQEATVEISAELLFGYVSGTEPATIAAIERAMGWYRATAGQLSRDDMADALHHINKILREREEKTR